MVSPPLEVSPTNSSISSHLRLDIDSHSVHQSFKKGTPVQLTWCHVTATVNDQSSSNSSSIEYGENGGIEKGRKTILNDAFGMAKPGEITAIMGSSGSGKTSLLNVLTRRNLDGIEVEGSVQGNGRHLGNDSLRKLSAYVQQDDLFIGSLTVKEHLSFVARLKMGRKSTIAEQKNRVAIVIEELGLQEVSNTIIGTRTRKGLSGGEKKRLAFASEIITNPPLLFCDEPTSGLDAFLALQVLKVLQDLSRRHNTTIVITIHQPSSQVFEIFDSLYLMAEGRVAYSGNQENAVTMWKRFGYPVPQNFNPADHFIRTLAVTQKDEIKERNKVNNMCDMFMESEYGRAILAIARPDERLRDFDDETTRGEMKEQRKRHTYMARFDQQLLMLCWRNIMTTLREPTLLKVQICHSIIIGLLTGVVYVGTPLLQSTVLTINGSLFQCIQNMSFMFQFSVVHHFSSEVPVFLREHHNSLYRVSSYFLAKNIVEFPVFLFLSFLFCSVLYWMSPLVSSLSAFLIYCLVSSLVQAVAISVGYFFSCAVPRLPIAMAIMPIFVVPMMAFAGFFINQDTLPIYFYPFKYLSWFNYGYEALSVNEWMRVDEIPGCVSTNTTLSHCLYPTGSDVLHSLSFSVSHLWRNVFLLCALIVLFRIFAFISLLYRSRKPH